MKKFKVKIDLSQFCWNTSREVKRTVEIEAESKGDAIRKALKANFFHSANQIYCDATEIV